MSLDRKAVLKVALLGRLQLSDSEVETMTEQLSRVVGYVEQLQKVDTTNQAPMAHAIELRNVFRDDELATSLPRTEALANAPKHDGECFRVPAVLGE